MKRQPAAGVFLEVLLVGALLGCGGKQVDSTATEAGSPSDGPASGAPNAAPKPFVPHAPKNHRASATTCAVRDDAGLGDGSPDGGFKDGGSTACTSDTDCPGTVCECGQDPACFQKNQNVCLQSGNCRIDSDCGPGGYCSYSYDGAYCGHQHPSGYFCHTASDTCADDSDCPRDEFGPESCQISNQDTTWSCRPAGP